MIPEWARGLAAAVPEGIRRQKAQTATAPSLAVRESITAPIAPCPLALEPEGLGDRVDGAGRGIGRRQGLAQPEPAGVLLHQREQLLRNGHRQPEQLAGLERPR